MFPQLKITSSKLTALSPESTDARALESLRRCTTFVTGRLLVQRDTFAGIQRVPLVDILTHVPLHGQQHRRPSTTFTRPQRRFQHH